MKQSVNAVAFAAILVLGAACAQRPATAQTTPAPETSTTEGDRMRRGPGGRGDRMQMLFNGITLTADQQSQIQAIRDKHRSANQGLDPRNNPDDRTKMMNDMQAQMAEVRAVLTADQQTQFDKNVAEMRQRMQERRSGPDGPPPGGPPAGER
jgi:Spy/CpxP family protein refolding chaperone